MIKDKEKEKLIERVDRQTEERGRGENKIKRERDVRQRQR